jgi:hypothetical protein
MIQQKYLFDQNGYFWTCQFLHNEEAFPFYTINKLALLYTTPLISPHTLPPISQLAHLFQNFLPLVSFTVRVLISLFDMEVVLGLQSCIFSFFKSSLR